MNTMTYNSRNYNNINLNQEISDIYNRYESGSELCTDQEKYSHDDFTEAVQIYFREASKHRLLTQHETEQLCERIAAGDRKAAQTLVCANMRLLYKIIKDQFMGHGIALEDLLQEGMVVMMKAATSYDPSRGAFSTYAYQAVTHALRKLTNGNAVFLRMTDDLMTHSRLIKKATERYYAEYETNSEPSCEYLAEATGLTVDQVRDARQFKATPIGTDAPAYHDDEEGSISISDLMRDEACTDNHLEQEILQSNLRRALNAVDNKRNVEIFKLFHGLGCEKQSAEDIALQFGLTAASIRLIDKRVLQELVQSSYLADFCA